MSWVRKISPADYITIGNAVLGFVAITYIVDRRFLIASALIVVAMIVDGLDGEVARRFGSKHKKGRYLDSFSDTISFCFAPGLLLYGTFYDPSRGTALTSLENAWALFASCLVVVFGIFRLARFAEVDHKKDFFAGLPTPANAFLLVYLSFAFGPEGLFLASGSALASLRVYLVLGVVIAAAFLMISSIPYPKGTGDLRLRGVFLLILAMFPFLFREWGWSSLWPATWVFTVLSLVFVFGYVLWGPHIVREAESGQEVLQV